MWNRPKTRATVNWLVAIGRQGILALGLMLVLAGCGGGGGGSSAPAASNTKPVANAGTLAVTKNTAQNCTLSATDADGDSLTYSIVTNGTKGVVILPNAATGACTYTPNANATGSDSFTFKTNDSKDDSNTATITVTISAVKVPDTGQTQSYTSTFGEDHDYTINPPSYTAHGNGTVTDNVTGLMWQQQDDGVSRTWYNAIAYCDNLGLAGYSDWRLPTKKELMGIVIYGSYLPAIDTTAFPSTQTAFYWSSTTYADDTNYAWIVGFGDGYVYHGYKFSHYYVRCVRGGQ